MADTPRIEELRRRVQRDPASIAFAQLAEEYRRAGRFAEAIETCEQGLAHHPGYLSARVTLGRSYLEMDNLDAAQLELKQVLRAAPENLAALRGLAEIHHRRGELQEALAHYRTALEFARNDPELQQLVEEIAQQVAPEPDGPQAVDEMSFEDVQNTFLNISKFEGASEDVLRTGGGCAVADPPAVNDLAAHAFDEASPVSERADAEEPFPANDFAAHAAVEPSPVNELAPDDEEPFQWPSEDTALSSAVHAEPIATDTVNACDPSGELVASPTDVATLEDAAVLAATSAGEAVLADGGAEAALEAQPGGGPAAQPTDPAASRADDPQIDALERWLDAIIAERQRRS